MRKETIEILEELTELVYEQDFNQLKIELEKTKIDLSQNNESEHTLLHVAAKVEGSENIIELLIQKGIDVNVLDINGHTPLLDAVLYHCPKNLKTLIELGGNIELQNNENNAPLVTACANKENIECVKILLENGALVNRIIEKRLTSNTPLKAAIYSAKSIELVEYLFEQGADANIESPILTAISRENIEILTLLVKKGAKIKGVKNTNGESVNDFAIRVGNKEIIRFIEKQQNGS